MRAYKYVIPAVLFTPFMASAQSLQTISSLVSALINYTIALMIGAAIIAFFYGLIRYVLLKGGEEQKKGAIRMMVNGVIAIAVMLSIYGLVRVLQNSIGVNNNTLVPPPSIGQLQIESR